MKNKPAHRPLIGESPRSVKIAVRIEQSDYDLIVKKYGRISTGINQLIKELREKSKE